MKLSHKDIPSSLLESVDLSKRGFTESEGKAGGAVIFTLSPQGRGLWGLLTLGSACSVSTHMALELLTVVRMAPDLRAGSTC